MPSGVEGSYSGSLPSGDKVRLNMICLEDDRIVSTLADFAGGAFILNFANATIDEDQLILSAFPLLGSERKNYSSKGVASYIRLKLADIYNRQFSALLMHRNLGQFLEIQFSKIQNFPVLTSAVPAGSKALKGWLRGTFHFGAFGGTALLSADVLAGIPFFNFLASKESTARQLTDGAPWDGSGLFSMASSSADGESDGRPLFYIRGRLLGEHAIEFYTIDGSHGLRGPFEGIKF